MEKEISQKKKEFLTLYWFALGLLAIIGVVNLFAISADSLRAAAIVNLVLLILTIIVFVAGYIDFKHYTPLSTRKEIAYCGLGVIAVWVYLIRFNVQNYVYVLDYYGEAYYIPWVSAFVALYLAIGVVSVTLTFLNLHERRKQVKYYYAVAAGSIISSIILLATTSGTYVELFWAPLALMNIDNPITIDTGMTILSLRVIVEYGIFIFHAHKERAHKNHSHEQEHRPEIVYMCTVAIVFMLINIIVLPIIKTAGTINYQYFESYFYAYESIEGISVGVLLILGITIACQQRKSEKFGQIYKRMGIASIVFALVYLIMDFFPIARVMGAENEVQAAVMYDVFSSIIQVLGLAAYTAYVAFNKKLKATLKALDIEHEERTSSELYSI